MKLSTKCPNCGIEHEVSKKATSKTTLQVMSELEKQLDESVKSCECLKK